MYLDIISALSESSGDEGPSTSTSAGGCDFGELYNGLLLAHVTFHAGCILYLCLFVSHLVGGMLWACSSAIMDLMYLDSGSQGHRRSRPDGEQPSTSRAPTSELGKLYFLYITLQNVVLVNS